MSSARNGRPGGRGTVCSGRGSQFEQDVRSDNDGNGYGLITGWTETNGGTNTQLQPFNNGKTIPDGSLIAFVPGTGEISQTLPDLVNGQMYERSYYEDSRGNSATPASIEVDLGGQVIVAAHDVTSTPTYVHQVVDFTYTGTSGSALLELKSLRAATAQTDNTALFDQVLVPEPASLATLAIGSLGLLARRRQA